MPNNQKGPVSSQGGFAHILGLLLLVVGLGVSVYLVGQKTNLFSRAASAPIGCRSDSNCPSGYKCQLQATTLRYCPESTPSCNTFTGKCVPIPTSKPPISSPISPTPISSTITHVVLYPNRNIVPRASGDVWIQVLNYNTGADLGRVKINGTLRQLMPNRIYKVYLCGSDGSTCATSTNPQIRTNAFGTVSFDQLIFDVYNRSTNSVSDVKVLESPPSGPIAPNTCYLAATPCLGGGYTMPRIYITPTPRLTPGPTSIPTPPPVSCSVCGADANKNGKVDITDMMRIAQCMRVGYSGSAPGNYSCQNADTNGDRQINASDLNCAREQFGRICAQPQPVPAPQ